MKETTYRNTSEEWGGSETGLTVADYLKMAELWTPGRRTHHPKITSDHRHVYADGVAVADAE